MRKQHLTIWITIITLFMLMTNVYAGDWEKLGSRKVKHGVDRDVIHVGSKEGTFTAIKFTVKKAGIHFMDMKVHFMNGDVIDVKIRKLIPRGGETRIIDLPGKNRMIEKVVFWYETLPKNAKRATVRLWARH